MWSYRQNQSDEIYTTSRGPTTFTPGGDNTGLLFLEGLITQVGISAPEFTALFRNQLGVDITFEYTDVGIYTILGLGDYSYIEWLMIEIGEGRTSTVVAPNFVTVIKTTAIPLDHFTIYTFGWDGEAFTLSDDILNTTPFRIITYPHV